MKFISLGRIDKKIFLILFLMLIVSLVMTPIFIFLGKETDNKIENIILKIIIYYSFFIFYIFPDYIIKKKSSNKRKIDNEKQKLENDNNKVVYLYSNTSKKVSLKNYLYIAFLFILNYIIDLVFAICFMIYNDKFNLLLNEFEFVMEIIFYYLIFRLLHKMTFYKHHNLSIIILTFIELIKGFIWIFFIKKINFSLPNDLLSLIPLIIHPANGSFQIYLIKRYMEYKYFSPFFVNFLLGLVYAIISIILLPIFLNVDCGEKLKVVLCEIQSISKLVIILNICHGILFSIRTFLMYKLINDFTVFHILLFYSIDIFINDIISYFSKYNNLILIISIVPFIFEIFLLSIFLEIIELNFCGLNFNLKKNIITRSKVEINGIYVTNLINEDEDSNSDIIFDNNNEDEDEKSTY